MESVVAFLRPIGHLTFANLRAMSKPSEATGARFAMFARSLERISKSIERISLGCPAIIPLGFTLLASLGFRKLDDAFGFVFVLFG